MRIQVSWDNEKHSVVRLTLLDNWSWDELYVANEEIVAMMKTSPQTVHLLIDYTQANTVPMGGVITHARIILGAYPPNCDTHPRYAQYADAAASGHFPED